MATCKSHGVARNFLILSKVAITLLLTLEGFKKAIATQFTVGDTTGWGLGNDLQAWSSQLQFHVGDELYFSYPAGQHSVLLVTEDDFNNCNTENPITSDNGLGDMVISLVDSETYYFICGVPGHCAQGLRLSIIVQPASPDTSATPPPDVDVTHYPPPDEVTHYPPPPDEVESPPDAAPVTTTLSPPYYSKLNTFHRNSSPPLYTSILAYSLSMALGISYIFLML